MKNLGGMMKQAAQIQAKMEKIKEMMEDLRIDGSAGAGLVKVTMTGRGDLHSVTIDPKVIDLDDMDMLQDLIVAAHADAKSQVELIVAEEMQKATEGLNLPGMGGGGNGRLPF